MRLQLGSLFALTAVHSVLSQGTDLGGGIVTRTDVEYLADLALDIRDIRQNNDGSSLALQIYLDGRNSEPVIGSKFSLAQLSTDLADLGVSRATPSYLFHLFGLAERSVDPVDLASNGLYADAYTRSAITAGRLDVPQTLLVLNVWMYATHMLYEGFRTCQLKTEADNPGQFDLKGGGLDEFIALWIGMGQTPASGEGYGLYALSQRADDFFDELDGEGTDALADIEEESYANQQIKLLYQEGASLLSLPGACTKENPESTKKLWSVASQILAQAHVPLFQLLIHSIMEQWGLSTQTYAMALVPQAAACRPSSYKRLNEFLMRDDPDFSKTTRIVNDLYDILECFGLTCDDIGVISDDYDIVVPDCIAATDRAPMAVYRPTSDVHPVSIVENSDFIH